MPNSSDRAKRGHETRALRDQVIQYIRMHPGEPGMSIAKRFGICRHTAQSYRQEVFGPRPRYTMKPDQVTRASNTPLAPVIVEPVTREQRYDAQEWKSRATKLDRQLHEAETEIKRLSGFLERPPDPPEWLAPAVSGSHRAVGLMLLSDWHVGEVVRPESAAGNTYDPNVFRTRIRRMFAASIEILPRWAADCELQGVVIALNGDLISGGIKDDLRATDAMPPMEQAWLAADEAIAGIAKVADAFGHVWVTCTPGNHGRTTEKPPSKRVEALSYDIMIGEMIRRHFLKDSRVSVLVSKGPDIEYPILGHAVFQSHGEALGTGGGKGFAGPVLPIARGARNVELQAYSTEKRYDIILTAHYHTSSNPARGVLANGSVVGYSEFANRIRARVEPPQQWLALVHERWGIRERCEIRLEETQMIRPRIRRAATGQAA